MGHFKIYLSHTKLMNVYIWLTKVSKICINGKKSKTTLTSKLWVPKMAKIGTPLVCGLKNNFSENFPILTHILSYELQNFNFPILKFQEALFKFEEMPAKTI